MNIDSYKFVDWNNKMKIFWMVLLLIGLTDISAQDAAIINLDSTHQVIRGFGAANILPWRPDMTEDEIEKAFGTEDGQIGFSILRLRVPPYENEFGLNTATAKAAYSMGVKIIASPWSPPASMKTNNSTVGGELRESSYDDYAAHLKKFVDYMADNDAPIYAVSVQNEPDVSVSYESCDWNASQMLKFVRENARSIGTKVIAPESFQFRRQLSDPLLNDSTALANFDILGGHIYGGGLTPYPLAEEKGKEIWMTEHLILETDWQDNLSTGKDILDCMNAGMSAYIWWYIVRFYGPIYDEGSDYRTPPGAVKGEISKRGYVMSQYSRFIRPGFVRLEAYSIPQRDVYMSAYKSDTSIVIVAINNSSLVKTQTFTLQNGTAEMFTPYVTTKTKNCSQESSISVSDNNFTATLEGKSITTFVSSDYTVSTEDIPVNPNGFNLLQNYPNPFNPSTMINYSISETTNVSLDVYDILGCHVQTLVNREQSPGIYKVEFNVSDVSSGIYIYRLKAGTFIDVKQMLLMK